MALTDLTRISTSGIATGTSLSGAILHGDAHFRGTQVGVTSALFDSSDNALEFNDNVILKFGNSGDLSIYHNGSDNYIDGNSNAEDHLYIRANVGADHSSNIHLQAKSGEESIVCRDDESVELYFNGYQKLRTTNYGAVITGILTATSFSGPVVGNTNNASGISTFYDLRVSNNLTVEGTTTTLDTNLIGVDRVEVGANSNTIVGVAITQSGTADILNLYDGSTKKLVVDDQGNVGIKTLAPAHNLDVYLTGRFNQAGAGGHGVLVGGGTYTGGFTYMSSGDMEISCAMTNKDIVFSDAVGGNQRMRLTGDTGRLGIGTDNAVAQLDVYKGTSATDVDIFSVRSKTGAFNIQCSDTDAANPEWRLRTYSNEDIVFSPGGTGAAGEKLRITSDGKVGIGSADPGFPLEVYSNNTSTNNQLRIEQDGTGDAVMGFALTGTRAYSLGIDNDDSDKFKISTATNLHTNTLLTIDGGSGGKVGIGTDNPIGKLHLNYNGNNGISFRMENFEGSTTFHNDGGALHIDSGFHLFRNEDGSSEFLRIDSDGQIGIGNITPDTWSTGHGLTIGTSQATLWGVGDQVNLSGNAYFNSGWKAAATKAGASQIQQALGQIDLRVTGSVSADAAITWIDALSITKTGKVGINDTAPERTVDIRGSNCMVQLEGTGGGGRQYSLCSTDNTTGAAVGSAGNFVIYDDTAGQARLRIDTSGRVMIGTTTEGTVNSDDLTIATTGNTGMTIRSGTTSDGAIHFSRATSGVEEYAGFIEYDHNTDLFTMGTNSNRFLSADSDLVITLGKPSFGGASRVIVYGGAGGIDKNSLSVLNPTASVAGRGAGVAVGGNTDILGSFYAKKSGNADSAGGDVFLESVGAISFITGGDLTNFISNTERLHITSAGDVLIGKTSGDHILDINASSDEIRLSKASASDYTGIQLDRDASGNAGGYFGLAGAANHYITGSAQHDICVRSEANLVFSAGGGTERFRIASDGDVTVTGTGDPVLTVTGSGHAQLTLTSTSGTDHCGVNFGDSSDHNAGMIQYTNSTNHMQFHTNGRETMRLDSNGSLKIYRSNSTASQMFSTLEHMESTPMREHVRYISAGASSATINLMRVRRHYWGAGFYKIWLKQVYYVATNEAVWWLNGHGRNTGGYSPSWNLGHEDKNGSISSNVIQITSASNSSPGNDYATYVDVYATVSAYHHYIVHIEAMGSVAYSTDTSSVSNDGYALF